MCWNSVVWIRQNKRRQNNFACEVDSTGGLRSHEGLLDGSRDPPTEIGNDVWNSWMDRTDYKMINSDGWVICWQLRQQRPIYKSGCSYPLLMWIEGTLDIVGAISLGFAILHVSSKYLCTVILGFFQSVNCAYEHYELFSVPWFNNNRNNNNSNKIYTHWKPLIKNIYHLCSEYY